MNLLDDLWFLLETLALGATGLVAFGVAIYLMVRFFDLCNDVTFIREHIEKEQKEKEKTR